MFFALQNKILEEFSINDLPEHSTILRQTYKMWLSASKNGLPQKTDLNSDDFKKIIGNIAFVGFDKNSPHAKRLKYYLAGNNLSLILGKNLSQEYLDEIYSKNILKRITKSYTDAIENKQEQYASIRWRTLMRRVGYDRLLLPLYQDNGEIDVILAAFEPSDNKIKRRKDWEDAPDIKQMNNFFKSMQKM